MPGAAKSPSLTLTVNTHTTERRHCAFVLAMKLAAPEFRCRQPALGPVRRVGLHEPVRWQHQRPHQTCQTDKFPFAPRRLQRLWLVSALENRHARLAATADFQQHVGCFFRWCDLVACTRLRQKSRQHQHRFCVGWRKTCVCCSAVRQPLERRVLCRAQAHHGVGRNAQTENMLGVAGYTRGIAVPPSRINFVNVCYPPIPELVGICINAGFFLDFAGSGVLKRFVQKISGACHTLPKTGVVCTLDQQHIKSWRVNHHQH